MSRALALVSSRRRVARVRSGNGTTDRDVVASVFCDVDPDEFKAACSIPLFPGKWNTWLLWVSVADDPDEETIRRMVKAALRTWFMESASLEGFTLGNVDTVEIDFDPPAEFGAGVGGSPEVSRLLANRARLVRREDDCSETIALRSGQAIPVVAQFVYRGRQTRMPWPVIKIQRTGIPTPGGLGMIGEGETLFGELAIVRWCPTQADVILESVWRPLENESVPDEGPGLPGLPRDWRLPDIDKRITDAAKGVSGEIQKILWPIAIGAVAIAVIALRK